MGDRPHRLHPTSYKSLRRSGRPIAALLERGVLPASATRRDGWGGDMFQQERENRFRDHVVMTGTSVACLLKIGERAARNPSPASYACVVHPPLATQTA